jgi:hypothetical protein
MIFKPSEQVLLFEIRIATPTNKVQLILYGMVANSSLAVPLCTSALDEASVQTKARTAAKSFISNKPDKYAICFYAMVGSHNTYLSSLIDSRSGNKTGVSGPDEYCIIFKVMHSVYTYLKHLKLVEEGSASALWILQMAHQTKLHPDPSGKRIFFTDNYYNRHILALALKLVTDGEACITGTVKFTNINSTNQTYVSAAIKELKDAERGSWILVHAYDKAETSCGCSKEVTKV